MRLALLADVHGNSIALERCLAVSSELDVDATYLLGDCVGYLPGEQECLSMLTASDVTCQLGNHERMMLSPTEQSARNEEIYGLGAAAARMKPADSEWLRTWPETREIELDGRRILLVHGSPEDPLEGYVYPDADLSGYAEVSYDAVLMAHTHRPFVSRAGETLVANVGSVGLPRDVGRLSSMAIYDSATNSIRVLRPSLDVEAVLDRWGESLHPSTRACLQRETSEFVGEELV